MPSTLPERLLAKPLSADAMSTSLQARLADFRQQRRVHAGSLIISVFGDAILPRGGRIWLGSLIRLLEPLELNERLIRTSVFRLAKEEWLRTETIGRRADYVLTPSGRRRFEEASRHIYAGQAPLWDRRWRLILLLTHSPTSRPPSVKSSRSTERRGTIFPTGSLSRRNARSS